MGELSKIIPEIFYDILGRFVPGFLALFVWTSTLRPALPATTIAATFAGPLASSTVAWLGGVLVIAYAIGHLLSPFSSAVHTAVLPRIFPSYFSVLKRVISPEGDYPSEMGKALRDEAEKLLGPKPMEHSAAQLRRVTYIWYDWVRIADTTAGTRLAKTRAEYRMLEGFYILFAFGVAFAFVPGLIGGKASDSIPPAVACLVGMLASAWAAVRLFRTFQWAVLNQYFQLRDSTRESLNKCDAHGVEARRAADGFAAR